MVRRRETSLSAISGCERMQKRPSCEGKKLITYPRAEARHLAENQIADVPAIVAAMTRLRGFAHLQIDRPVIRRGKSGHFCDKALEGVSHHAVVLNVNVMDDLEARERRAASVR
jgi:DNA topoisomerase III